MMCGVCVRIVNYHHDSAVAAAAMLHSVHMCVFHKMCSHAVFWIRLTSSPAIGARTSVRVVCSQARTCARRRYVCVCGTEWAPSTTDTLCVWELAPHRTILCYILTHCESCASDRRDETTMLRSTTWTWSNTLHMIKRTSVCVRV